MKLIYTVLITIAFLVTNKSHAKDPNNDYKASNEYWDQVAKRNLVDTAGAKTFVKKAGCQFSAIKTSGKYKGKTHKIALCFDSYQSQGAVPQNFCWLRPMNMKTGRYVLAARRYKRFKVSGTMCNQTSMKKLIQVAFNQTMTGPGDKWIIITDFVKSSKYFRQKFN